MTADADIEPYLAGKDEQLGRLMEAVIAEKKSVQRFQKSSYASNFESLAGAIVSQQLSTKAAASIFGRLKAGVGGTLRPSTLSQMRPEELRSLGVSGAKARYLLALAEAVTTEQLRPDDLAALSDEAILTTLTALPGIGQWTAQMFLMFRLHRSDVLPVADLGIRKGFARMLGAKQLPTEDQMHKRGALWKPWCSIASLYLWRSLDIDYRRE